MRKFALAFATLICVSAPALAGPAVSSADKPLVMAQSSSVTVRDRGPSVTIRTGDRDHFERRRHRGWMARERGCHVTTIRERHGNRVIVKKIRRC
jgi:hypothetical protein